MFTPDELRDLPDIISAPRFATYLRAQGNDVAHALDLYHWNLETSSAFLVPLQICEVAVRNGVVEAIEKVHGPNWPRSNGFLQSLPQSRRGYDPGRDLAETAAREPTTGKVVAELKFAFWGKVFTKGQDRRLWVPHLHTAFPGVPAATTATAARAEAFHALAHIRKFRNRIAHHEPIFTRNLQEDLDLIRDVIRWRRPTAEAWVGKIERVTALIGQKP